MSSDVLFFPGARHLGEIIHDVRVAALYLPDLPGALTEAVLRDGEAERPVNSGFFVLHEPLDVRLGRERFAAAGAALSWTRPWLHRFWLRAAPDVLAPHGSAGQGR
jgi:hypothetical protein